MSLKVLLVDDDKMALFLQKIIILESKFTLELNTFTNGKDALHYLEDHSGAGHDFFIFLDINMPHMNGWQLLDAINNRSQFTDRVFVAMVSSYSTITDEAAYSNYEQIVYTFEKPVTIEGCREIMELSSLKKYFKNQRV